MFPWKTGGAVSVRVLEDRKPTLSHRASIPADMVRKTANQNKSAYIHSVLQFPQAAVDWFEMYLLFQYSKCGVPQVFYGQPGMQLVSEKLYIASTRALLLHWFEQEGSPNAETTNKVTLYYDSFYVSRYHKGLTP